MDVGKKSHMGQSDEELNLGTRERCSIWSCEYTMPAGTPPELNDRA